MLESAETYSPSETAVMRVGDPGVGMISVSAVPGMFRAKMMPSSTQAIAVRMARPRTRKTPARHM